jgi:nucleoside-diphosphate-sugar epimerase
MIHGPENKGNLTLLFKLINRGIPYPLGLFNNRRSFLSIENLGFVINEILINPIESGIYQLADNDSISTRDLIELMGQTRGVKPHIWNVPKVFIIIFARIGDLFRLPFNSHSLIKLTESYRVSNKKIVTAIGKPLPISIKDGLKSTFVSLMK